MLFQSDPSAHTKSLAKYSNASTTHVQQAIDSALTAKPLWESMPFTDRAAIFLKAADLISGKYRYEIMAATMLGQGKNAWQAEIDAAAELCDFLRYDSRHACFKFVPLLTPGQIQCPVRRAAVRRTTRTQRTWRVEVSLDVRAKTLRTELTLP